jgi:hypothetical protein
MSAKTIPNTFLMLTHEGLSRVTIVSESVQSIDQILAKFASDKHLFIYGAGENPFGLVHVSGWTGNSHRTWAILELSKGQMMFSTQYGERKGNDPDGKEVTWISPTFFKDSSGGGFPLRCLFDFSVWAKDGLRMFLGLNTTNRGVYLWVLYTPVGQIYRPPFGNIFESSCQICLGHNTEQLNDIFFPRQPHSTSTAKAVQALGASTWNHDTFRAADATPLSGLVRFNPAKPDLPMLPPTDPALITKCSIASNKDLVDITHALLAHEKLLGIGPTADF